MEVVLYSSQPHSALRWLTPSDYARNHAIFRETEQQLKQDFSSNKRYGFRARLAKMPHCSTVRLFEQLLRNDFNCCRRVFSS